MITFINKNEYTKSQPVINICGNKKDNKDLKNLLLEEISNFTSWRSPSIHSLKYLKLDKTLSKKVLALTKILNGNKPSLTKKLGSEFLVTKIWSLQINKNNYNIFYNNNGISIETSTENIVIQDAINDLKELNMLMKNNLIQIMKKEET